MLGGLGYNSPQNTEHRKVGTWEMVGLADCYGFFYYDFFGVSVLACKYIAGVADTLKYKITYLTSSNSQLVFPLWCRERKEGGGGEEGRKGKRLYVQPIQFIAAGGFFTW